MDELPSLWIRCAAAYVQNSTDPPLGVAVSLEHIDGQPVFRIDVPLAAPGPVATKDGYYTKRVLDTLGQPQCVPMSPQEIVSMGMITRGQDYAAAVAGSGQRGAQAHGRPW